MLSSQNYDFYIFIIYQIYEASQNSSTICLTRGQLITRSVHRGVTHFTEHFLKNNVHSNAAVILNKPRAKKSVRRLGKDKNIKVVNVMIIIINIATAVHGRHNTTIFTSANIGVLHRSSVYKHYRGIIEDKKKNKLNVNAYFSFSNDKSLRQFFFYSKHELFMFFSLVT